MKKIEEIKKGQLIWTEGLEKPIIYMGSTSRGEIIYKEVKLQDNMRTLEVNFRKNKWVTFEEMYENNVTNPLSQWIGKQIIRIRPTPQTNKKAYMSNPVKLIAVSKDCMVIEERCKSLGWMGIEIKKNHILGREFVRDIQGWVEYEKVYDGPERNPDFLYYLLTKKK